jgi:hypothetical protein
MRLVQNKHTNIKFKIRIIIENKIIRKYIRTISCILGSENCWLITCLYLFLFKIKPYKDQMYVTDYQCLLINMGYPPKVAEGQPYK